MKIHRFYVEKIEGNKIESVDLYNQFKNVLRLKIGEKVVLFDNSGLDYEASIESYDEANKKGSVTIKINGSKENAVKPKVEVSLFVALIKKDKFEWVVEKATELGVVSIIPVLAKRSEKKDVNEARLAKIAIEASEQSGRATIPKLNDPLDLRIALELAKKEGKKIIALDPNGNSGDWASGDNVAIFIGPEGGWTDEELAIFKSKNASIVSLGKQILRAETAALAVLAKVLL